jgi:cardiolipin synthase
MNSAIWTIPNALSLLRLLGVPIFIFFVRAEEFTLAFFLLLLAGLTDYLDGKIARRFNQMSRLGELLDPAADRLYIIAVLISLYFLDVIPLAVLLLIVVRDLTLALLLAVMKRNQIAPFKITYLGKAATFNLLYAFPCLLLTLHGNDLVAEAAFIFGWAFSAWGIGLYLLTGGQYFQSGIRALRIPKGSLQ